MKEPVDYKIKDLSFRMEDGYATMSFKINNKDGESMTYHAGHRMLPHHLYVPDGEPVEIRPREVCDLIGNATLFMMITGEGNDSVMNIQFRPGPTPPDDSKDGKIANASGLAVIPSLMKKNHLISGDDAAKFTRAIAQHFGISPTEVSFTAAVSTDIKPVR